jgi:(p)ppGpp synthase/HD superfamily hydrolase
MEKDSQQNSTGTLEKAIILAAESHSGQVDKAGVAYVLHPLRVMLRLKTPDEMIVGVLHDVVEDTNVTLEDLRKSGFSEVIVEAIDALTKRSGESRLEAGVRAKRNPLARRVKLADIAENMDLGRIPLPSEKDLKRTREYLLVRDLLEKD